MKLTMVGVGYVGLVAAACLADGGNHVVCVDTDEKKIANLKKGIIPIYEPGLGEIVKHNAEAGRLHFTTDLQEGVEKSLVIYLEVHGDKHPSLATSYCNIGMVYDRQGEYVKALEYYDASKEKQPSLKYIKIYTDSTYVRDGITIWINNWEQNNWKTSEKKNVKNVDLWKKLKDLVEKKQIEWHWIKGHSNDPMNDLADKLAKQATPK